MELIMVWLPSSTDEDLSDELEKIKGDDRREFYAHVFNGCYAVLMFVVVIFFLIYGVEVFFKVRGGFAVSKIPNDIGSTRISSTVDGGLFLDPDEKHRRRAQRKRQRRRIKEEENSIRRTSGAEELNDLQQIQNIRKEGEAFEDPTFEDSLITTSSSIQTEGKNYQLSLKKQSPNNHQICQIA